MLHIACVRSSKSFRCCWHPPWGLLWELLFVLQYIAMRSCVLWKGAFLIHLSRRSHRSIFTFFYLLHLFQFYSLPALSTFLSEHISVWMSFGWFTIHHLPNNYCRYWQGIGHISSKLTSKLRVMKLNCRLSSTKFFIKVFTENFSSQLYVFIASSFRVHFQLEQCVGLNCTEMGTQMLWSNEKLLFILTPWYQYKN